MSSQSYSDGPSLPPSLKLWRTACTAGYFVSQKAEEQGFGVPSPEVMATGDRRGRNNRDLTIILGLLEFHNL